jgi:hypothetical protein
MMGDVTLTHPTGCSAVARKLSESFFPYVGRMSQRRYPPPTRASPKSFHVHGGLRFAHPSYELNNNRESRSQICSALQPLAALQPHMAVYNHQRNHSIQLININLIKIKQL